VPAEHLRAYLESKRAAYLDDLSVLSSMDCGTYDKPGVNAAGAMLRARLEDLGLAVEVHDGGTLGSSLVARWHGHGTAKLLLLGHLDTVYPAGWPAAHPFEIRGDVALGPGTCDMKAGVLAGLYALDALRATGFDHYGEIAYLLTSDEEIGAPSSRWLIEREARGRDAVLVLEAGRENGGIVSARKGVAFFTLTTHGRAAHAGVEPEKGRNAILALAHHIVALQALNGVVPNATLNVGVVDGGMRPNVVPEEASAQVDVRAADHAALEAIIAAIRAQAARLTVPETTAELAGGISYPPMEKTPASARLVEWCQEAAREAGFTVRDAVTGGGSDGNTTAALGVPTLDGLGPVGGLDHSPREYIEVASVVPRIAMLAGLIEKICRQPGSW